MFFQLLLSIPLFMLQGDANRNCGAELGKLSTDVDSLLQLALVGARAVANEDPAILGSEGMGTPFPAFGNASSPALAGAKPTAAHSVDCEARASYLQLKARELRNKLSKVQAPDDCVCARQLLYVTPDSEGFAHMTHVLGFMLQTGLMSERTVIPVGNMPYCPPGSSRHDFFCFFEPAIAPCGYAYAQRSKCGKSLFKPSSSESEAGPKYLQHVNGPFALANGPQRRVKMIDVWKINEQNDTLVHRTGVMNARFLNMGNFWVRSQVQDWAWQLKADIKQYVGQHPLTVSLAGKKYVGIHLRTSDVKLDKPQIFSVDIDKAVTLERALKIAESIRAIDSGVTTIFLATDTQARIQEAEKMLPELQRRGWQMYWAQNAIRATHEQETEWTWFKGNRSSMGFDAILDLEALRNAHYLVGSMLSNVFRLSVELNYGRRTFEGVVDAFCDAEHYYSFDYPWFQDL